MPPGRSAATSTSSAAAARLPKSRSCSSAPTPSADAAPAPSPSGAGNPPLAEPQLQQLADAVVARGIRTIAGSVVGDESLFDALRGGPATGGAFDLNFAGALGALTYAHGR